MSIVDPRRLAAHVAVAIVLASPAFAAPTYVGGNTCAECHKAEAERWRGSHHDKAMEAANSSTVLGRFDGTTFSYEGVTSTFRHKGDEYTARTDGADGKLKDFPIAYTFGVEPLQQYLIAAPGGRFQALSIAWDSRPKAEGGQRWFHLYPTEKVGFGDVLHWTAPSQNWNARCADCHSTDLRENFDVGQDTYDTKWSDVDVSCEACHGPGSEHIAWARGGADASNATRGLVVRLDEATPAHWIFDANAPIAHRSRPRTSHAELESCAPCHARRSTIRSAPLPAAPLLESYRPSLLDDGLYHADGQIDGEVYEYGSFLQSRMFQQGVTCSDCHEPHSLELRAEGNALCSRCHAPVVFDTAAHHHHKPGSEGASCVSCHMPAKLYMVIDRRHDHGFRVPRPDLSVSLGVPNACNGCHRDRDAAWAAKAVQGWPGTHRWKEPHFAQAIAAGRRGAVDAEKQLAQLVDDAAQPGIARATAAALLSAYVGNTSLPALRRALKAEDPLIRMGALEATQGLEPAARPALVLPLLDDPVRAVRIAAARNLSPVPAENLTAPQREAVAQGLAEYREAQAAQADQPSAHLNLALIALEQSQAAEADRELQIALRLSPQFIPAYVNLADLRRGQGREKEAEGLLRRAIAIAPEQGSAHHALGLLLVRTKRIDEAIVELGRAADLDPDETRNAYVLGIALNSTGKSEQALAVLRRAHERRPADRAVLFALATISRDVGARDEARAWTAQLLAIDPADANAAGLMRELGDR